MQNVRYTGVLLHLLEVGVNARWGSWGRRCACNVRMLRLIHNIHS